MSCKQEFDETLIDCVYSFPVIYDPSNKSYKDRTAKDNALKCIAAAVGRNGKFILFSLFNTKYVYSSDIVFNIENITNT
jgi:hypothetical protein